MRNISKIEKSQYCKLDDSTRQLIFSEFDKVTAMLKAAGVSYNRRFSEPRKAGRAYRCKWWICEPDSYDIIRDIQKSLPEGWVVDFGVGGGYWYNLPSVSVYTKAY